MSEGALRWPLASRLLMAEQIEHLIQVSRQPNVRLGIIDQTTPKPIAAPAAFQLLDRTATVATEVGTSFVTNPRDFACFEDLFEQLDTLALTGDAGRALLTRITKDYRSKQ